MVEDGAWWQAIGAVAVLIGLLSGVIKWLLGKIEAVRMSNDAATDRLRAEMSARLDAHAREYREDRTEAQRWREGAAVTMASMVTRVELERQLRNQSDDIIGRLDVRVTPLLEDRRRTRNAEGD